MVPQHNHDLQLIVSQSEMMDTGAVQIQLASGNNNSGVPALATLLVDTAGLEQSIVNGQTVTMVQQQQQQQQQQQMIPPVMFGSQMVDKNSSTPYTDATQVRPLSPALERRRASKQPDRPTKRGYSYTLSSDEDETDMAGPG